VTAPAVDFDAVTDRRPPQDIEAEQAVLGGMLLSKDVISDVVEIVTVGDFYRPNHAVVFAAIMNLFGKGEPADAVTVAGALYDSGDLVRVGGVPYLHTLVESVPTAANAPYYARIVAERAVLRRLVEVGTRITQLGYGAAAGEGRDLAEIVDLAQQAVYDITTDRKAGDFSVLAEMLQPTLDEIEAAAAPAPPRRAPRPGSSTWTGSSTGCRPGRWSSWRGGPVSGSPRSAWISPGPRRSAAPWRRRSSRWRCRRWRW
jgi:replicative DNA helicase